MRHLRYLLLLALSLVALHANAQTVVVFTDNTAGGTFDGVATAELREDGGGGSNPNVSDATTPARVRGMVGIPTLSTDITGPVDVTDVDIELYQSVSNGNTYNVCVHKVLRAVNYAQVDWTEYSTGNNWASPGGLGTGDSNASPSATVSVSGTDSEYKLLSSAQLAQDAEDAINAGQTINWLFKSCAEAGTGGDKLFTATDGTDGQRPKVTITYTAAGAASGLLLRRRRN